jgi:hypothetical protein
MAEVEVPLAEAGFSEYPIYFTTALGTMVGNPPYLNTGSNDNYLQTTGSGGTIGGGEGPNPVFVVARLQPFQAPAGFVPTGARVERTITSGDTTHPEVAVTWGVDGKFDGDYRYYLTPATTYMPPDTWTTWSDELLFNDPPTGDGQDLPSFLAGVADGMNLSVRAGEAGLYQVSALRLFLTGGGGDPFPPVGDPVDLVGLPVSKSGLGANAAPPYVDFIGRHH